jgi:hypothetical protein
MESQHISSSLPFSAPAKPEPRGNLILLKILSIRHLTSLKFTPLRFVSVLNSQFSSRLSEGSREASGILHELLSAFHLSMAIRHYWISTNFRKRADRNRRWNGVVKGGKVFPAFPSFVLNFIRYFISHPPTPFTSSSHTYLRTDKPKRESIVLGVTYISPISILILVFLFVSFSFSTRQNFLIARLRSPSLWNAFHSILAHH